MVHTAPNGIGNSQSVALPFFTSFEAVRRRE
jgi:hypothetical protein